MQLLKKETYFVKPSTIESRRFYFWIVRGFFTFCQNLLDKEIEKQINSGVRAKRYGLRIAIISELSDNSEHHVESIEKAVNDGEMIDYPRMVLWFGVQVIATGAFHRTPNAMLGIYINDNGIHVGFKHFRIKGRAPKSAQKGMPPVMRLERYFSESAIKEALIVSLDHVMNNAMLHSASVLTPKPRV